MAYKEKDTKKWTAQWFETNAKGEKKKRRKRGFETKREALEYERQKKLNNSRSMDMKLSEFMEVYFGDKQNELKERTMKNKTPTAKDIENGYRENELIALFELPAHWLMSQMNSYCVGANYVFLDGKHYYTVHHA